MQTLSVRVRPSELATNHERYVLGGILADGKEAFAKARAIITADDFGSEARASVFRAMEAAVVAGEDLDSQHVLAQLTVAGAKVNPTHVVSLARWTPATSVAFATAVEGVRTEAQLRRLGNDLRHTADASSQPDWGIGDAARAMSMLSFVGQEVRRPRKLGEVLEKALSHQVMQTLWCGMPRAERFLRAGRGHLIILGGETGKGKSQMAQQMAYAHAAGGVDVYYVTYEMPAEEVAARQISRESGLDLEVLLAGGLDPDEQERVDAAKTRIQEYAQHIEIDDTGPDIDEMVMRIRLAQMRMPLLQLVVIDYLQIVPAPRDRKDLRDERPRLEYITGELQRLGQQIRVPILLLSQFSRAVGAAAMRKPTLDVLRGSARIEQDANMVLLLWHPKPRKYEREPLSFLIVAKGRSAKEGRLIALRWRKAVQTFEDGPIGARAPEQDDEPETAPWPTE